jgi:hypothetical protein
MSITDPNERARRAIIRSIDNLTELVNIVLDDPNDQNPDPLAFIVEPDDLFNLTFSRIGITSEALISGFVVGLKTLLPEIRNRIQELLADLEAGVQIRLVFNVVRRELAVALANGGDGGGGAATKAPAKSAGKVGGSAKAPAKKSSKKTG